MRGSKSEEVEEADKTQADRRLASLRDTPPDPGTQAPEGHDVTQGHSARRRDTGTAGHSRHTRDPQDTLKTLETQWRTRDRHTKERRHKGAATQSTGATPPGAVEHAESASPEAFRDASTEAGVAGVAGVGSPCRGCWQDQGG